MGNSEQRFLEGVDSGAIILLFWWGPGKIGFVFQGVFEGCRFWDGPRASQGGVAAVWSKPVICIGVRYWLLTGTTLRLNWRFAGDKPGEIRIKHSGVHSPQEFSTPIEGLRGRR